MHGLSKNFFPPLCIADNFGLSQGGGTRYVLPQTPIEAIWVLLTSHTGRKKKKKKQKTKIDWTSGDGIQPVNFLECFISCYHSVGRPAGCVEYIQKIWVAEPLILFHLVCLLMNEIYMI